MSDEHTAYLSLGSNMGDRKAHLDRAVALLGEETGVTVVSVSSYIETKPVGYTDQPDFLNAAAELRTTLTPYGLLELCGAVERMLKRKRLIHWGPRTIDLDILLFDRTVMDEPLLTIPHPRMLERLFVLQPLAEIAPKAVHPVARRTIGELYASIRHS